MNRDVKIARRPTATPLLPLIKHAQGLSIVDSSRHSHANFAIELHIAAAFARIAVHRSTLTCTPTARARGTHHKHSLRSSDLTSATARTTNFEFAALGARAFASCARGGMR